MKKLFPKILKYTLLGIVIIPLSILTHELGHFLAYHFFGASNIQLHSVSVSADKEMLGSVQIAIVSIIGPTITYLTIGLAVFFTRKGYVHFWVILALAAPIGRIVNIVYIYFRVLGYNPNPNFDEYNFSRALSIEPLFLAIITGLIILITMVFFFRKVWLEGKFKELILVIFSLISGFVIWSVVGVWLLP
jgi:hypothetical protein